MGKLHKRYNWKSRQIVNTVIDETEQSNIQVELNENSTNYDASNALVLPSSKRKTKVIKEKGGPVRLLSKKQRKKLQKINDRKLKKVQREGILNELLKVQAKPKEMVVLTSLQSTQTLGRKKFSNPSFTSSAPVRAEKDEEKDSKKYMKWQTPKAVKRALKGKDVPSKKRIKDLNVVQSDSSSSSEDEESDPEEEEEEEEEGKEALEEAVIENGSDGQTNGETIDSDQNDEKDNHHEDREEDAKEDKDVSNSQEGKADVTESPPKKKAVKLSFKRLNRDPEVQKQRLKLPILSEEHTVMEAINEHPITIIVGQTGSGKTTQVPQFLYEAGYTNNGQMIGVTEPRRVAASSMAERVGHEMNLSPREVSYQVRYEGNVTPQTEVKFMTDGVLFRELKEDHSLSKYSAIIIDEAHERSVHSDLLIGLLSRIVPRRNKRGKPLKLIIMSATLRVQDFTENPNLFRDVLTPPVVKIQPRMFDVTVHFNKETDSDYSSAAFRKICRIHRNLPDGGILVFLTGQQEIQDLCQLLRQTFPLTTNAENGKEPLKANFHARIQDKRENRKNHKKKKMIHVPEVNLKDFSSRPPTSSQTGPGAVIEVSSDEENVFPDERDSDEDVSTDFLAGSEQPLWILPLYSMLPSHKQKRVFEPPPEGTRLCILATNVAETSLTIPNVKYVVDSGKTKQKLYDPVTGVSSFHVTWTSQASANQRAGRAGRTCDGFCYRLYSSAVFNDMFPVHATPDIQKRPLDDVVLTMKALKVPIVKFPFPTPPDPTHLTQSLKRLKVLGALADNPKLSLKKRNNRQDPLWDPTVITEMGKSMSELPLAPRFAKMVLFSMQHQGILAYVIIVIAALTVREVLIEIPLDGKNLQAAQRRWAAQRVKWSGTGASHYLGDLLVLIEMVLEAEKKHFSYQWCLENGIRHSALLEFRKLRRQLTNEINLLIPGANLSLQPHLKSPTDKQCSIIAEVVVMGTLEQVARKVESFELTAVEDKRAWKHAYRTLYSSKPVFLSSSSVLAKERPKYVMFQDIYETTKVFLRGITAIDEAWLVHHGENLVELSPPLDIPGPRFDSQKGRVVCSRKGLFGPDKWILKAYELPFPIGKDLFKWVAYFFLSGCLWPALKPFAKYLIDPKTLLSPVSIRYREKKENLIRALMTRNVTSSKLLEQVWKQEPEFLKSEYISWFEDDSEVGSLISKWPPLEEEQHWIIP